MEMHSGIDAVECQELMRNSLAFSGCQKKISRSIYLSTYIFLSDICVPFFFSLLLLSSVKMLWRRCLDGWLVEMEWCVMKEI